MKIHLLLMKINYSKKKEKRKCSKDYNSNNKHKQLQLKLVKPHRQQLVKIILLQLKTNLQFNISQLEKQCQTLRKAMQVLYSSLRKSILSLKYILLTQWWLAKFHYQIEIKTWLKNQLHQMYILPIQILLSYKYTDLLNNHAHL